jgi:hypothetical protein
LRELPGSPAGLSEEAPGPGPTAPIGRLYLVTRTAWVHARRPFESVTRART